MAQHRLIAKAAALLAEGKSVQVKYALGTGFHNLNSCSNLKGRGLAAVRVRPEPKIRPLDEELQLLVGKCIQRKRTDRTDTCLVLACHKHVNTGWYVSVALSSSIISLTTTELLRDWTLYDSEFSGLEAEWLGSESSVLGIKYFEEEQDVTELEEPTEESEEDFEEDDEALGIE